MSNRSHVAAGVQQSRVRAHAKTHAGKPHQRRSTLTLPNQTLVLDMVTGLRGVVLSGKVSHVLGPDAQAAGTTKTAFSLQVPRGVRVEHYAVELQTRETVSRTLDQLSTVAEV